jgi:hypothetical protein
LAKKLSFLSRGSLSSRQNIGKWELSKENPIRPIVAVFSASTCSFPNYKLPRTALYIFSAKEENTRKLKRAHEKIEDSQNKLELTTLVKIHRTK